MGVVVFQSIIFSEVHFWTLVAPLPRMYTGGTGPLPLQKQNWLATVSNNFLRHSSPPLLSCHPILSAKMPPQLNAAQHILINALLKEGFNTKLIATEASCSVRAVQRIRLKRQQQSEMPIPQRTNTVSRRTRITLPIQEALCDILIKQPYLYRCEMANFLYRKFCKRILERSIGRSLRLIGQTRTIIRRIAQ